MNGNAQQTQGTTGSQAMVKREPATLKEWIAASKGAFKMVLPSGWSVDRFVRIAQSMLSRDPKLERCDARDLVLALITIAQLGLEPNGPTGEAYIIPFNTYDPVRRQKRMMPTVVIGFRGLLKLMWQSGQVEACCCECVYENDHFEIELGSDARIVHRPLLKGDRGPLIATYMVTKIKGAISPLIDFMTRAEIDAIRDGSKGYLFAKQQQAEGKDWASHPWISNYGEMARKTQIRRACKDVPMSTETSLARAIEVDGRAERGAKPVIDVEIVSSLPPELGVTADDARLEDEQAHDEAPAQSQAERLRAQAGVPAERPALAEAAAKKPIEQELAQATKQATPAPAQTAAPGTRGRPQRAPAPTPQPTPHVAERDAEPPPTWQPTEREPGSEG